MQCILEKSKVGLFDGSYVIKDTNQEGYTARIPNGYQYHKIELYKNSILKYKMKFTMKSCIKDLLDKGVHNLYEIYSFDEKNIGEIFFTSYSSLSSVQKECKISIFGINLVAYTVGLGNEGIKIPIYCNKIQIGLIEKPCEVINGKNIYHIIYADEKYFEMILLISLYYDANAFSQWGQIYMGKKTFKLVTKDIEILNKYNKEWKEQQ